LSLSLRYVEALLLKRGVVVRHGPLLGELVAQTASKLPNCAPRQPGMIIKGINLRHWLFYQDSLSLTS
jgi:hypothetical protein